MAGLRFVFAHPLLRPLACFSANAFFFFGFIGTLYVLYAIRELKLPPAALGVAITTGGVGAMLGASLAARIARRLGTGWTFIGTMFAVVLSYSFMVAAHGRLTVALSFLVMQQLFGDASFAIFNVNELSLRQAVAPPDVLGRVNAAMQLLTRGIYPLGALAGGVLAQRVGIRETLAIAVAGFALSITWLIASPIRRLREVPA